MSKRYALILHHVLADVDLAAVAQAIGDPARAAILLQLMDGRAFAASELAAVAGIKPSTASSHLRRLREVGLVTASSTGRQRFHRLASTQVAEAIETLAAVSPPQLPRSLQSSRAGDQLVIARSCYGHLAGRLGVAITRRLINDDVVPPLDAGQTGSVRRVDHALFVELGIDHLAHHSGPPVRACRDWSQRVPHLAGTVGRSILGALLERQWLRRRDSSRALAVTSTGESHLQALNIIW